MDTFQGARRIHSLQLVCLLQPSLELRPFLLLWFPSSPRGPLPVVILLGRSAVRVQVLLVTFPPRLPWSAGFSFVGTWCHLIRSFSLIFLTRLDTNCRYSPCPFIQYRATVESSQQWTDMIFSLPIARSTLVTRFEAI